MSRAHPESNIIEQGSMITGSHEDLLPKHYPDRSNRAVVSLKRSRTACQTQGLSTRPIISCGFRGIPLRYATARKTRGRSHQTFAAQ